MRHKTRNVPGVVVAQLRPMWRSNKVEPQTALVPLLTRGFLEAAAQEDGPPLTGARKLVATVGLAIAGVGVIVERFTFPTMKIWYVALLMVGVGFFDVPFCGPPFQIAALDGHDLECHSGEPSRGWRRADTQFLPCQTPLNSGVCRNDLLKSATRPYVPAASSS